MKKLVLNKWFIRTCVVVFGLLAGYFIKPKALQPYIAEIYNGTYQAIADGQRIEYIDVNGDQNSEEFIYYHLSDNRQPVVNQYSSSGEFQNVWYLDGEVAENFDFITGDYNNDSLKEVYVFSFYRQCLCLYGLIPGKSNRFLIEKESVFKFDEKIDYRHIAIRSGGVVDLNNDGFGEVIFTANSRFTTSPRGVFAYDIVNDSLYKSVNFGLQLIGNPIVFDINGDNKPEIFLSTLNNTNQAWETPREQAQFSASFVLQSNLDYYMVPHLYENRMSVTSTFPVQGEPNKIASLSWPLRDDKNTRLLILNQNGEIIKRKNLLHESFVFDPKRSNWEHILLFNKKGHITEFNNQLSANKTTLLNSPINQVTFLDIDNNSKEEVVIVQNNKLTIFQNDFSNPVSIEIPGLNVNKVAFSVMHNSEFGNKLSVQNYNQHYLINYSKNKLYWLQYLVYLLSVIVSYGFYLMVRHFHYSQVNQIKHDNETFYLMQMELIRNQLDPHFLFNALNSISFSINKDDRKTAYSNVGLFSKFLRESIVSLDEFSRSLQEEVVYVKNYLALEKFRFKDKFNYDFIIGPGVVQSIKVPKLILFSFIESALKKGVLPKNIGGRIEITIDNIKGKGICIIVTDTGLYRNIENGFESHTKNMQMMHRIVSYFNKFNQTKIEICYEDLGGEVESKGSKVEIVIPPEYKYIV